MQIQSGGTPMPLPEQIPAIKRSSMGDQVYTTILDMIVSGDLQPGENLKDHELAERLGVSRTPVREALCRLREEELVRVYACKWTRVAEVSAEEIDQLIPIVSCLEVLALAQAFPSLGPDQVQQMEEQNRQIKQALLTGQFEVAAEANRAFHRIFTGQSENPELISLIARVKTKIRRLGTYYFQAHKIIPSATIAEHGELIQAISEKRLEDSQTLLARHWDQVAARLHQAAEKNPRQETS
jgi:DNA-binding GntR family transcriptional regulator